MFDVRTLALETQAHVPTYARWLEQADMAPAYAQHRLALQTLQSRLPTQRWILKTPNHLWDLEALLAAYPDARIIWTHRDPGPVVTSLASLANAAQRPLTSRSEPRPTAEEWKRKCRFALDSAVAFDERSDDGWCQHLHYDGLMADPVDTVRQLYAPLRRRGQRPARPAHARRSSSTGRRTPSAATATTRPTSGGPTPGWARSSPLHRPLPDPPGSPPPARARPPADRPGRGGRAPFGAAPIGRTIGACPNVRDTFPAAPACPPRVPTSGSWPRPRRCRPT